MTLEEEKNVLTEMKRHLHEQKANAITLRRAFGRPSSSAKTNEKMSYLEVTNDVPEFDFLSQLNWFIATLCAKQLSDENIALTKMEDYLHKLYHNPNTTDSVKSRITKLLCKKTTSRLLQEMIWFIKLANKDGVVINEYALYEDLKNWNNAAYRWARKISRKQGE